MPRASSVASAAYYDAPSGAGTPDPYANGFDNDSDELMQVDLDDPLAQQELDAFGTGAVVESLPAPPENPHALQQQAAQQAAGQEQQQAQGAAAAASAGGKRTLAASGPLAARAKRPKNVKFSPAKTGKQLARRAAAPGGLPGDVQLPNNDFCDACGGKGHFLCCEGGCLRSFHFQCLEPPLDLDDVPDESWYCKACRAAAHPPPKPPRGYWSDLIYKTETENPKQFSLTNELKGFLKHVASGTSGEFIDSTEHRPPSKITGRAIGQEDRDGYRLKDKNGRSIICYNCDEAAQPHKYRRIISCDFCDQHWHLDCLDPPMTGMPPPTRKWMCPLHSDHVVPKKRSVKSLQMIPLNRRDEPNNGDIVILPAKEKVSNDEVEELVVNRVRYQVPEQHIILDFWGRVTDGPRSRRKGQPKAKKHRSPRKASGYDSGNSSPLTDLSSSDDDSDAEPSASATPAPTASTSAASALDNLALLAEVRYIDLLSSSSSSAAGPSSSAAGSATAAKDKGKARASVGAPSLPPALPNSTQRRGGPRPSMPVTGSSDAVAGAVTPSSAAGVRGASPSLSPAPSHVAGLPRRDSSGSTGLSGVGAGGAGAGGAGAGGAAFSTELAVESKDDLQALMRVRKMIKEAAAKKEAEAAAVGGGAGPGADEAKKRATMLAFLEGEAIVPRLDFMKAASTPWNRPWEQQRGGAKPSPSATPAPLQPLSKPATPAPSAIAAADVKPAVDSSAAAAAPSEPSSSATLSAPAEEAPLPFSLPGKTGPPSSGAAANGGGGESSMQVDEAAK
ncbi:hypothetical protein JCM8097_006051 [Rhodosporidiobolus ruineniae]